MSKVSVQELSSVLMERQHLNKKDASKFVSEMFYLIQKALDEDKLVKVKGLGTFRIIDVEDRESVNVNTGDRMLIEGHGKITFTPDNLMKELVNKPFSQFETVVLNEGVDFEDEQPSESVAEPEVEQVVEPDVEQVPEPVTDEIESIDDPSVVPLVDFVTEPEPESAPEPEPETKTEPEPEPEPAPALVVEPESEAEPIVEAEAEQNAAPEQETEIEEELVEETKRRSLLWPVVALVACVLGFGIGYLVGHNSAVEPWTPDKTVQVAQKVPQTAQKAPQAAQKAPQAAPRKTVAEEPVSAPQKPVAQEPVDLDKYEQLDVRIRTGAYRIVGTDHVEKVRANDNLARICKRTLGPGMECYIEAYNGINAKTELKTGQEIKIPKLELKKKKAK
ncbi:MAG: HU family DNA-binding protein [Prevotella sp.]|nr:HU family DNA-binding protein [Prevotella sp.]